jgi:hypothetical protein
MTAFGRSTDIRETSHVVIVRVDSDNSAALAAAVSE